MNLKQILKGDFMKHPLHPATVHLPLGGWIMSSLLDAASMVKPDKHLVKAAGYANRAALIASLPSIASGLADYLDIEDRQTFNWATLHFGLNAAVAALSMLSWKLRSEDPDAERTPAKVAVTQLAMVGTLLVSGYIGGLMVYEKGMRVIPLEPKGEQKQTPQIERVYEEAKKKVRNLG